MSNNYGYIPSTDQELDVLYQSMSDRFGAHRFGDLAAPLAGSGAGKLSLPFLSVRKFHPGAFEDDPQQTGDCTSHGTRNAHDISRAVEIDLKGESEEWVARGATEGIYGARGHGGEGMSPAVASKWCHDYGILVRKKYEFADLSKYNPGVGIRWGGQGGPPSAAREEAKKHPCEYVAAIESVEEARDALANGYGLHCGSQAGFEGNRDQKGIIRWNGSWNHDMCWGAVDDTKERYQRMLFLVINSWGKYNAGPLVHGQPQGSMWVVEEDIRRMIQTGEVWAVGNVRGFPKQDLPDYYSSLAG